MSESSQRSQPQLDPLLQGYLDYLADVGRKAPRTVIDVRCTLRRVSSVLESMSPNEPMWKLPLTDYLRWIEAERQQGRSVGNISKQISHVRGFLNYAWRSGRCDRNVLDGFQLQDNRGRPEEPPSLSLEDAERLLQGCRTNTAVERRDRIAVLLLYGCGLRTQELCCLRVQDINVSRKELTVMAGKGDRQRIVPLPDVVHTEVLAYLVERTGKRGPLLRRETGKRGPLASRDICAIVAAAATRGGISRKVTPLMLRHSFATHLMDRGVDVAIISRLMGHRSPRETGVYLHALKDRPRAAVHRLADWQDAAPTEPATEGDEPS
jgi:integrase/recombinase XerD